jgi:hypothetical protein
MTICLRPAEPVMILRYATASDLLRMDPAPPEVRRTALLDGLACCVVAAEEFPAREEVCYRYALMGSRGQREVDEALEMCAILLAIHGLPSCAVDPVDPARWAYLDEHTGSWRSVTRTSMIRLGEAIARGRREDPLPAWVAADDTAVVRGDLARGVTS